MVKVIIVELLNGSKQAGVSERFFYFWLHPSRFLPGNAHNDERSNIGETMGWEDEMRKRRSTRDTNNTSKILILY